MTVMANHKKHTYLDPALSVIRKFSGPGGRLSVGINAVAAITGRHRTNVYRWMLPAEARGTGGFVPAAEQRRLLEYAKEAGMRLKPQDFFDAAEAA